MVASNLLLDTIDYACENNSKLEYLTMILIKFTAQFEICRQNTKKKKTRLDILLASREAKMFYLSVPCSTNVLYSYIQIKLNCR